MLQAIRIYSKGIEMIFDIENAHTHNTEWKKTQISRGITLSKKKRRISLGDKEKYEYLVIFEADTIRHAVIKEKKKKNVP